MESNTETQTFSGDPLPATHKILRQIRDCLSAESWSNAVTAASSLKSCHAANRAPLNFFQKAVESSLEGCRDGLLTKTEMKKAILEAFDRMKDACLNHATYTRIYRNEDVLKQHTRSSLSKMNSYREDVYQVSQENRYVALRLPIIPLTKPGLDPAKVARHLDAFSLEGYTVLQDQDVLVVSRQFMFEWINKKDPRSCDLDTGRISDPKIFSALRQVYIDKVLKKARPLFPASSTLQEKLSSMNGDLFFWFIRSEDMAALLDCTVMNSRVSGIEVISWSFPFKN